MAKLKSFGRITVCNKDKPAEGPLHLTFTNEKAYRDTKLELEGRGYTVDAYWGFAVLPSREEAMKSVTVFSGERAA